jgi:hypothetical protein
MALVALNPDPRIVSMPHMRVVVDAAVGLAALGLAGEAMAPRIGHWVQS